MNLIIDVGNTYIKIAVFSKFKLLKKDTVEYKNFKTITLEVLDKYQKIDKAIVSSVGRLKTSQISFLKKKLKVLELTYKVKLPFKNKYQSKHTLGVDRIALAAGSVFLYPKNNALIIDAGTCITYDFVNSKNEYLGGAISPGIRVRYKSLNDLTANLPLLEKKAPRDIIGKTTNASIHSGVVNGVVKEIDGIVKEYSIKYPDLTVILTGGDANFLSKRLKSSIFANSNFLLEGLNYILDYNFK